MKSTFLLALALIFTPMTKTIYDFNMKDIDGKQVSLSQYKGKVVLIVNVASLCGNTPQYKDIEAMYEKYKDKGLVVLGFPANNFMGQEPGSDEKIKAFCSREYHVTFPMFSKISVKGSDMHPLYKFLTEKTENGVIDAPVKWNFQKFLIGRDGRVITSIGNHTSVNEPEVVSQIEAALGK
jgi:glutathione peroxidase